MVGVLAAVVAGGILIALALGSDLQDLPWGAIILALVLGGFFLVVQRRRRRAIRQMDDPNDDA
jgi:hypothetical protein